jgi:hypothetical protein
MSFRTCLFGAWILPTPTIEKIILLSLTELLKLAFPNTCPPAAGELGNEMLKGYKMVMPNIKSNFSEAK